MADVCPQVFYEVGGIVAITDEKNSNRSVRAVMNTVPFLSRTSRAQATAAAVAAAPPAVMTSQYGTNSVRPRVDPLAAEATVDLLNRAKRGDRSALELLLERCIPALRRWAHARLPQSARGMVDTADMVQDTVLAALRRLEVLSLIHI